MMVYFTSDHHFYHLNIIRYCNRPFNSVDEMNNEMVNRWNSVVKPNDTVYHLGDFAFSMEQVDEILSNLNGEIYLLPGNHDIHWVRDFERSIRNGRINLKLQLTPQQFDIEFATNKGNYLFTLSHYPMRSWFRSHHGSYHLYGHIHSKNDSYGLSFDVGVDAQDYTPISLDQVIERMNHVAEIPYTVYERKFGEPV